MKKPPNKQDQSDLKNRLSPDANTVRVPSKAVVQRKNSLQLFNQKNLDARRDKNFSSAASKRKPSNRTSNTTNINTAKEMEFLFERGTKKQTTNRVSLHVRVHIVLLVFGLFGSIACFWTMLHTADAEKVALKLGLERVANSLENVLSLLAYPVLMFTVILTIYSIQQLYFAYRRANYLGNGGPRRSR